MELQIGAKAIFLHRTGPIFYFSILRKGIHGSESRFSRICNIGNQERIRSEV
ncbi:hypothetical protein LEP1GSC061_1664 [Leptospira wolffii serovar Khorat str. Khorat-H2]|nr:hypothetical protein LEP1GSC061_1664 [Leptospira wolffii serovar Khorat str. Khorat-H2]